jgi:peptidoglycan/LPS O-acetylase OafA/YrhL
MRGATTLQSVRPLVRHFPALDGVRGVAILMVIAHHAALFDSGWIGVDLFFVLSGYLITGILVGARADPHYFRNFWMRRALRILPACAAFLAVLLVISPWLLGERLPAHQIWLWLFAANLTIARHGFSAVPPYTAHLWSLAVEEQFYLIWPFVVLACSVRTLRRVCVAGIVLALAFRVLLHLHNTGLAIYVLMPTRMDALLVGGWLAITPVSRRTAGLVGGAAGMLTVVILAGHEAHSRLVETIGYTAIAVTGGALVSLATQDERVIRVLSWRPFRTAGKYSYAAYLWQIVVLMEVGSRTSLHAGWQAFIAGALGTYLIAWISWRLIEAPALRLKRFFPEARPREPETLLRAA